MMLYLIIGEYYITLCSSFHFPFHYPYVYLYYPTLATTQACTLPSYPKMSNPAASEPTQLLQRHQEFLREKKKGKALRSPSENLETLEKEYADVYGYLQNFDAGKELE